ncbi:MAG: TonB-dependent receptor [Bacteroidales bacterium]|nr:TonB-dependent receptor [Bacteroidales bacterium]
MKRAILLIATILLCINTLIAQHTITGTLVDDTTNDPLMFVNVGLIRAADTVYVSGTASNDKGFFKLEHVRNGQYILQITAIGYENYKNVLDVTEDINLGTIKMHEGAVRLDEVVIVESKPLFANEGEKTLYNVSEDPSIQTGTLSDALQNAPGVEVDVEGNITLRGVSSVEIWINGKPSHLNEENLKTYIQQLPANAIKTIEVITNPSARYASKSDGGIINIVTNVNVQKNQFVSFGVRGSSRPDVSPWVSYVYATEKLSFNLYLNGNYRYNKNENNGYSYSFMDSEINPGALDTTTTTRYYGKGKENSFGGGFFLNFQYNIDTMNNVSVWMGGWPSWSNSDSWQDYYRNEYRDNMIHERNHYYTLSDATGDFMGFNGGAEYQHLFNNEGHNITFSLNGGYWGGHDNSTNARTYFNPDGSVQRLSGYRNNYRFGDFNYDANIDYNLPYIKGGEIGLGVSYSHDPDNYHIIYDTLINASTYVNDNLRTLDRLSWSNEFDAYLTIQQKFGNFTIKPGIRMEFADVHCNMDGYMIDHESKQYVNWRPSIHMSYRTKSMHNFKLNYSRRINNPNARYLTNFIEYEQESVDMGNMDLKSVYTNSIEAGWTKFFMKFGSVGLSAYYRDSDGAINNVTENYYDTLFFNRWVRATKPYNVDNSYNLGFEANIMYRPTGFLNVRLYANVYDSYYSTKFYGQKVESEMWSYSLRLNVWAKLWNKLEVHASGFYRSPTQTLYAEREASYAINCGLRADFFDKKMSVHLNVNDIFNWNRWDNNTSNPYYISYSSYRFNSRSISAGVTFRFGKMELERQAREGGEDMGGDMPTGSGK